MLSSRNPPSLALLFLPLLGGMLGSCATARFPDDAASAATVPESGRSLAGDDVSRREAALEVVHLDGLEEHVLSLSGLDEILRESFRGAFLRDLNAPSRGMSLAARGKLEEIAQVTRQTFRRDALRNDLVARLTERPGAAHLEEVLIFLRGSSYSRLAEARAYVRTPAGQRALASFLAGVATRPPHEGRLTQVKHLLTGSRQVELMSVLSFGASRATLEAIEDALPAELAGGFERWLDQQPKNIETFEQGITRTLLLQDYFALHALDDAQLGDVLRFWTSPAGRWWSSARVDETRDLVEQRARLLKQRLARRACDDEEAPCEGPPVSVERAPAP